MLVTEHREKWEMIESVMRNYWWPRVTRDVGKYVDGYNIC